MSVKTTTKGSRVRIFGFGHKKYNGYYTSFSCDKSTRPTVDTYDKYVYTHTSGGTSLKIYKDGNRYYWGIFEGSSLRYKRIINTGIYNINLLSFPWEDSHIPWTYGDSVTSLAYFNIEYCGEMSKEYGNIYSDMLTATIADASGTGDYCFKKKTNITSAHPLSSDVWACSQNNETKLVCLLNFETSTSVGSAFKDDTGNCTVKQQGQSATYLNNSSYPAKFGSGCFYTNYFNESEAGLVISNVPRLDAFTIEFWCRYFGDADKENLNQTWGGIIVRDIGTGEYLMSYPFTDIIKGTYYHHAFVRESGSFIVHEYINGVEVAQSMFTGCFGGDFQLSPGGWQVKNTYKTMDGLAIWNYAKYNGTFTPQSSAYVASDYSTNITDPSYKYEIKWNMKDSDNNPCLLFTQKTYSSGEATESDYNGLYTYEGEFNNKPYYSNGTYYILYRPCTDTNNIYNYGWLLTKINGGTPESSLNNIYVRSHLCDGYTYDSAGISTEKADAAYEYPWSANWYNDMMTYEYEITPLNGDGCWSLFKDGEEIGYFGEMIYPPIPKLFPWEGGSSNNIVLHLIKEGSIDSIKLDANGCRYVLDGSSCPLEGYSFSCLDGSDVAKCDSKNAFFIKNNKPSTILGDNAYSSYKAVLYDDENNSVYAFGSGMDAPDGSIDVGDSGNYGVSGNFWKYSANNVSIQNVGGNDNPEIDYNDYALVNGSKYTRINTEGDNNQDNYPVYFDGGIREDSNLDGAGVLKFNTTLGKWEHIVPSQQNSVFHRAKTTGVNGLTGEWENINVSENLTVEYTGTLPEWNGTIPDIEVTTPVTLTGTQNSAITDLQLTATVSDGGTPTFTSSDLPAGLTLSNTGLISGTPTGSGQGTSTITVSYDGAESKTITLNWTIEAAGNGEKTYVYTASGFNDGKADGDYYLTELTYDGYPVYYNGTMYLFFGDFFAVGLQWAFSEYTPVTGAIKYFRYVGEELLGTNVWQADLGNSTITATIENYSGSATRNYVYTMTGAGTDIANGNYYDTGEVFDDFPVYKNDNGVYLFNNHSNGCWVCSDTAPTEDFDLFIGSPNYYYGWGYYAPPETTQGSIPAGGNWVLPAPTLAAYTGSGDAPDTEEVIINVTTPVILTGTQNNAITDLQLVATVSDGGQATFTSSDLPEGLTLSSTGLIGGTPTVSGEGSSTITVSYAGAESKTITLNWTIEAASSGDKTYVYTVSGATSSDCNGSYYEVPRPDNTSSEIPTTHKIYMNEFGRYMACCSTRWSGWFLADSDGVTGEPGCAAYAQGTLDLTEPPTSSEKTWYNTFDNSQLTVEKHIVGDGDTGDSGDDENTGSDGGDTTNKVLKYTVNGAGTTAFDGNYFETGVEINGQPSYMQDGTEESGTPKIIYYSSNKWWLNYTSTTLSQLKASTDPAGDLAGLATTGYYTNDANILGEWITNEITVKSPAPTVTEYGTQPDDGDSGSAARDYVCTMIGCVVEGVNGDYWDSGETFDYDGANVKKYINESGYYFGGLEYSSTIYLYSPDNVLLYELTMGSDISNYYGTTLGDMGGGSPAPTIIAHVGGDTGDFFVPNDEDTVVLFYPPAAGNSVTNLATGASRLNAEPVIGNISVENGKMVFGADSPLITFPADSLPEGVFSTGEFTLDIWYSTDFDNYTGHSSLMGLFGNASGSRYDWLTRSDGKIWVGGRDSTPLVAAGEPLPPRRLTLEVWNNGGTLTWTTYLNGVKNQEGTYTDSTVRNKELYLGWVEGTRFLQGTVAFFSIRAAADHKGQSFEVTENPYDSDSGDSGDTATRNYVYTMSGAGTDIANGNYYDTGEVYDDFPVYRNDNGIYLFHSHGQGWWYCSELSPADFVYDWSNNFYYGWGWNAPPTLTKGYDNYGGSWVAPAPTITEYDSTE